MAKGIKFGQALSGRFGRSGASGAKPQRSTASSLPTPRAGRSQLGGSGIARTTAVANTRRGGGRTPA